MPDEINEDKSKRQRPELSDGGYNSPTIYVDSLRGTMLSKNVVKINLLEYRQDLITKVQKSVVVGRLVLPVSQVSTWKKLFERIEKDIEERTSKEMIEPSPEE